MFTCISIFIYQRQADGLLQICNDTNPVKNSTNFKIHSLSSNFHIYQIIFLATTSCDKWCPEGILETLLPPPPPHSSPPSLLIFLKWPIYVSGIVHVCLHIRPCGVVVPCRNVKTLCIYIPSS